MRNLKSVIAAGGLGTRLQNFRGNESTKILLDVLGVPMIVHQINQLRKWGCSEFVLITNPDFGNLIEGVTTKAFPNLDFKFAIQNEPKGIAEAFLIAQDFIGNDNVSLILGDNIFYFPSLSSIVIPSIKSIGASIFAYHVSDPSRYGVVEFNEQNHIISIEEKPKKPKSN